VDADENSPIRDYVSPSHVIGTEFEVKLKGYEDVSSNMDFKYSDGDELVFTGGFVQKNLNANKTIWIEREIGKYPVLAFGNSGSDTSMMNYALDSRNPYPAVSYADIKDYPKNGHDFMHPLQRCALLRGCPHMDPSVALRSIWFDNEFRQRIQKHRILI